MPSRGDELRDQQERERLDRAVPRSAPARAQPSEPDGTMVDAHDPVVSALLERNRLLREGNTDVRALQEEVSGLREQLAAKPGRGEVASKRYVRWVLLAAGLFVFVTAYVAIVVHEVYRDSCELIAAEDHRPGWCGWLFPFDGDGAGVDHDH